jgi:hypothetical protein
MMRGAGNFSSLNDIKLDEVIKVLWVMAVVVSICGLFYGSIGLFVWLYFQVVGEPFYIMYIVCLIAIWAVIRDVRQINSEPKEDKLYAKRGEELKAMAEARAIRSLNK